MDIIDNYLDVMFSHYPHTARTIEAKAELRTMMEDVYNGAIAAGRSQNEAIGQAISEFGNLDEVGPLLGWSSTGPASPASHEYGTATAQSSPSSIPGSPSPIPGDDTYPALTAQVPGVPLSDPQAASWDSPLPPPAPYSPPQWEPTVPPAERPRPAITLTQATNYAEVCRQTRWMLGGSIALFVIAPLPLVSLNVAASEADGTASAIASIIGFAVLLPLVAAGVGMLIWRSLKLKPFERITQGIGSPTPEVEAFAEALRREHAGQQTRALIIAISLWILSAFPLLLSAFLSDGLPQNEANPYIAVGLAGTLVLVAAGLLLFLPANWANSVANALSEEGLAEARQESEMSDPNRYPAWVRAFFAGYWPMMAAIYLAWSFIGDAWGISWIIWPIAGVSFAAIAAIVSAVYPKSTNA